MPRLIGIDAYTYGELDSRAQLVARSDVKAHMLRTAQMILRNSLIKPFFETEGEEAGFYITDESFYNEIARAIRGYDQFKGSFAETRTVGYVDTHKWAKGKQAIIPKAYFTMAEIIAFEGVIEPNGTFIYVADMQPKNDRKEAIERTKDFNKKCTNICRNGISPHFQNMFGALLVLIRDSTKEMLAHDQVQKALNSMYFNERGKFLCKQTEGFLIDLVESQTDVVEAENVRVIA